jgi:hypothetical protein
MPSSEYSSGVSHGSSNGSPVLRAKLTRASDPAGIGSVAAWQWSSPPNLSAFEPLFVPHSALPSPPRIVSQTVLVGPDSKPSVRAELDARWRIGSTSAVVPAVSVPPPR